MQVKAFEIRDRSTFIPAVGVLMAPTREPEGLPPVLARIAEAEAYLLGRSGYRSTQGLVLLARMDADGSANQASADAFSWGQTRTMTVAHQYIERHWSELESGAVICVETILGERAEPKKSERLESRYV